MKGFASQINNPEKQSPMINKHTKMKLCSKIARLHSELEVKLKNVVHMVLLVWSSKMQGGKVLESLTIIPEGQQGQPISGRFQVTER